jgi:hypothetical protein
MGGPMGGSTGGFTTTGFSLLSLGHAAKIKAPIKMMEKNKKTPVIFLLFFIMLLKH